MKKLFLIDAYALIFKYYYAFMGRPMRNRAGMNTSIVFGFTKFLRDIQKREHPDLLGVAFDPPGGCFRREIFPEYKANRPATPEDIINSVPYVKRIVKAMCIPILEVPGYEADDVIGTLAFKGAEAGYDVYMVTPDKDYGQLVGKNRQLYKQKGEGIEIVDTESICTKYGINDPQLVRDILALWGDSSDNIPGVPGIGEKGACKLVRTWGTVENIIANTDKIGGKTGASIEASVERLQLAKRLTTICLDVPIEFNEEDLTVCQPRIDDLRALFAELDFKAFQADLANIAPIQEPDRPVQAEQTQLANMARMKAGAAKRASLEGQGSLFGDLFATPTTEPSNTTSTIAADTLNEEMEVAATEESADTALTFKTIADTPHKYTIVRTADELRSVVEQAEQSEVLCFDLETTGFDIFGSRIVGISLAIREHEAWYIPFGHPGETLSRNEVESLYASILKPLFANPKIVKVG
ncbi:MAG: DNA polymerase I, partial [Alistipes sp.]|nr:DNA polymerase I [Alistipes sp.]